MENLQPISSIKSNSTLHTYYLKTSAPFTIQFGRPIKLPKLKKFHNTPIQHDKQSLLQTQTPINPSNSKQLNKQNCNTYKKNISSRLTTGENSFQIISKIQSLPKIQQQTTIIKHQSIQRLARIKSEQNIIHRVLDIVGNYKVCQLIGKGSYATVRLAKSWKGGSFAIKIYDKQKLLNSSQINNIKNEISVMSQINHQNIVKYYQTISTANSINIIMQLLQNTSLNKYIQIYPNKRLTEDHARLVMSEVLRAIAYLHSKNIVHRDLKLENILISQNGNIKLIDFGFSTFDTQLHFDFCGTPHYISPQIILKNGYMGQSADIWALGVIMYKLLTGNFPFRGLNDKILYKKILKGEYMKSLDVSGEANELIERMLSMNASERPTAQMLLRSNWIMDKKKMGY